MRIARLHLLFDDSRRVFLVRVDTDEGVSGYGECSPMHIGGLVAVMRDRVAPLVLHADPLRITDLEERFHRGNYKIAGQLPAMAWSGIDQALWDIRAKTAGQSLQTALGGRVRDQVRYYGSSMSRHLSPEAEAVKICEAIDRFGFQAIKIKIGTRMGGAGSMPDFRADQRKVRIIREAIGPDIALFVDGNGAYTAAQAVQVFDLLRAFDISVFEEPCPFMDQAAYGALAGRLPIPVNLGEQDWNLLVLRDLLVRNACQHVAMDVTKCGGFSCALRVAALCRAFGVLYVPHNTSRGIGLIATHHLALCLPECAAYQEYSIEAPDARDRYVIDAPVPRNGAVDAYAGHVPGMGVLLDEERMWCELDHLVLDGKTG